MTGPAAEAPIITIGADAYEIRHRGPLALLRAVRDVVAAHPERLDMSTWGHVTGTGNADGQACHTTYCVAGWAVVLTPRYRLHWDHSVLLDVTTASGEHQHVQRAARNLLGLGDGVARELFLDTEDDEVLPFLDALIRLGEAGENLRELAPRDVWDEIWRWADRA